jgi:Zn-dependent M28 family amino/carboxypeptidase
LFVAFDAEEIGKQGSEYFVAHPPISPKNMVLMINFDMVGKKAPNEINAVASRSSKELHEIHQSMNRYVRLRLNHPESFRLGRSDHTAFYEAGIPVLYLFGGLDADYNTPEDTWEKIIPEKVEKVSRLAFLTAYQVAQRPERIQFKPPIEDY